MQEEQIIDCYLNKLDNVSDEASVPALIEEMVNDPDMFWFGEILDHPKVSDSTGTLSLLAYGEWVGGCHQNLSEIAKQKLKKLTILSAFLEFGPAKPIPFDHLLARAGLEDEIQLFRTLLSMTQLVSVRIDELSRTVRLVTLHTSRDVPPGKVPAVMESLSNLKQRVHSFINS